MIKKFQLIFILIPFLCVSFKGLAQPELSQQLINSPQPYFPIQARTAKQQGFIYVAIEFDQEGEVVDIDVVNGKNKSPFIKSVLYSVSGWKMTPSEKTTRIIKQRFDFNLAKNTQLDMSIQEGNAQVVGALTKAPWNYKKYQTMIAKLKVQYGQYIARKHAIKKVKGV
jgi:TonB family protein